MIKKYKISVPKSTLNEIYKKVRNFPWSAAQNMNGWEYGTNLNYLKNISKYWITKYNWKKFERNLFLKRAIHLKIFHKFLYRKFRSLFYK